jgi:tetratricopeptide (TPR) repeat protein
MTISARRRALPIVAILILCAPGALALDFRGADDSGNLWDICKRRSSKPQVIINGCASAIKFGLGTSTSSTSVEYTGAALYRMAVAYRRNGNADLAAKHFAVAVQALDQAITAKPNDANIFQGRCWIKAVQNTDIAGAIADCDRSLKMDAGNRVTLDYHAFALYRSGRYAEALTAYNETLQVKHDNADALYMRGIVRKKLGDDAGANADMALAIQADSDIANIYAGYGIGL